MNTKPIYHMILNSHDSKLVIAAVNQGIDSYLEGFVQSEFYWNDHGKLVCNIATEHELQILLRRLLESCNDDAEQLADDIVYVHYGKETI